MKLLEIHGQNSVHVSGCVEVTQRGLRGKDDIVTVIDQATLDFCKGDGRDGLCTAKFRADLIVDGLQSCPVNTSLSWGTCEFLVTDRKKHCYPGCGLEPILCQLNNQVLFLKIKAPGQLCFGDPVLFKGDDHSI